jgi:DNA-binding transcriptional MerR regulator
MKDQILMTIGELSARSGVPASTLRYWERIKVLPKAQRVSGQRRYQPEASDIVAVLRLAKACGFSLVEMRRLVNGFRPETSASERWQTSIREHQKMLEQQIAQLNAMRQLLQSVQQCRCADLVECGRLVSTVLGSEPEAKGAQEILNRNPSVADGASR